MLFSWYFNIKLNQEMKWFNPVLDRDTKLFIDPFLIFNSNNPYFSNAHSDIIQFFNEGFKIASLSKKSARDIRYKQLLSMMKFPEVSEICLGYSAKDIKGSGSGSGFSKLIVDAIYESIEMGIKEINHFEELGIFNEGIGCDRISDITANILKKKFIIYTQKICQELNLQLKEIPIKHYEFNYNYKKWENRTVLLPEHPNKPKQGVILVPYEFLSRLPTLNPEDFFDYCFEDKNDELRTYFNNEIKSKINKHEIIELARTHRDWVNEYQKYKESSYKPSPYNLDQDPSGLYKWASSTIDFSVSNPIFINVTDNNTFYQSIETIIDQYVKFIELNAGYKLLWNEHQKTPRSEETTQITFTGIVRSYCKAYNIDLSRETNLGRGPVDFKFSNGYHHKVLLEVKLAKNSKFWNGLKKQLPLYLKVEEAKKGYFLVVCYTDEDFEKIEGIEETVKSVSKENGLDLKLKIVDASYNKSSASNL